MHLVHGVYDLYWTKIHTQGKQKHTHKCSTVSYQIPQFSKMKRANVGKQDQLYHLPDSLQKGSFPRGKVMFTSTDLWGPFDKLQTCKADTCIQRKIRSVKVPKLRVNVCQEKKEMGGKDE